MALHVGGDRHVAGDTARAGALRLVEGVGEGIDRRCLGELRERRGVALHAERIAGEHVLRGVRIVAVHAAHAGGVHLAPDEGGELVVLLAHLAVRIVSVRLVRNRERVMVEEVVARLEVTGEFRTACVALAAGVEHLVARELGQRRIIFCTAVPLLPFVVRLHRSVAGLAAHGALRHRGVEGVLRVVVVLAHAGVVAGRALGVPRHAAARPVAPFARLAVFGAIDIEPLGLLRVPCELERLQSSALGRDEELPQRIVADDALRDVGVELRAVTERDHFAAPVLLLRGGLLRGMGNLARGDEGGVIELRIERALGHAVVRVRPVLELLRVALAAARGAAVFRKGLRFRFEKLRARHGGHCGRARRLRLLRLAAGGGCQEQDREGGETEIHRERSARN